MLENIIGKQIKKQEETLDNWLNKRNENYPFPSHLVSLVENVSYGEHIYNKIDIYQPVNNKEELPIIINIHGGGLFTWKKGSKSFILCLISFKKICCILC